MSITIDIQQAELSLKKMHQYFSVREIAEQAQVKLPQNIEKLSPQHYCYLFFSCLANYGMKSSVLHENLCLLYEHKPELFAPAYIVSTYANKLSDLATILKSNVHIRYPNECTKRWFALSEILHSHYNDDPKEMFANKNKYDEFKSVISQIKGFGQKTGGLLLRMLIDNDMLSSIDGITEIPIDRHDIDLCVWLEVITNITSDEIKKSKKIISALSAAWVEASNKMEISPSITDQYLWIIGSQFCTSQSCTSCPLKEVCIHKE